QTDDQSTFSVDNQHLNKVLLEASKLGVTKFESVPPTLEDLFMRHYESYVVERRLIIMKEKFARCDTLFLQYLKRDWKKIVIWILGLGMFSAGFVPAFKEIAKGQGLVGMFETLQNPAMISMV